MTQNSQWMGLHTSKDLEWRNIAYRGEETQAIKGHLGLVNDSIVMWKTGLDIVIFFSSCGRGTIVEI